MHARLIVAIGLLGSLVLGGCGTGTGTIVTPTATSAPATATTTGSGTPAAATTPTPPPMRSVSLVMDWYPNSDHAGLYIAQNEGYFAQHRLNVKMSVPADASDGPRLVATDQAQFAISYEPDTLIAASKGLPIVSVAALMQKPLNCIIAAPSAHITRPKDMEGKRVGLAGTAGDYATMKTLLAYDHGDVSKVHEVNVGYDLVTALLSGKVDAIEGGYWTWEALILKSKGMNVNVLYQDQWGIPNHNELVIITSKKELQEHPDVVRDFLAAMSQGYHTAIQNPALAVSDLVKQPQGEGNPPLDPALTRQSVDLLVPIFQGSAPVFGWQDPAQWQQYEQWMEQQKLLSTHVDTTQVVNNSFLPAS